MKRIMPKMLMSAGFFIFVSFVFLNCGQAYDYSLDDNIDNNYNMQVATPTRVQTQLETESTQIQITQTTGGDVIDLQGSSVAVTPVVTPDLQPIGAISGAILEPGAPLRATVERNMLQPITQGRVAVVTPPTSTGWLQDMHDGAVAVLQDWDILPAPRADQRY
jgi:hypothetical protein